MNNLSIRAVEGGFTVHYYVNNPKYNAPNTTENPSKYVAKLLSKTRIFTDADLAIKFIAEQLASMEVTEESGDYY